VLLVAVSAAILGYAAWRSLVAPGKPDYRADLTWQARWIRASDGERSQAYFRGKLVLVDRPLHAWVAVMAPDEYEFRVNGAIVGRATYRSGYAQQVFDIAPFLRAGTNVLAVHNQISTFPQQARIVVEGQYQDRSGRVFDIRSDARWRGAGQDASLVTDGAVARSIRWFDAAYDDGNWPAAVESDVPRETLTQRLAHPPALITRPLPDQWAWAEGHEAREAHFRLVVNLDGRPRDAWLRVGARRHHRLLVNGRVLAIEEQTLGTGKAARGNLLFLYDLTPFLHAGKNVLAIHASNEMVDRGLVVDGFVEGTDGRRTWLSPSDWKVSRLAEASWTSPAFDDAAWGYASPIRATGKGERASFDRTVADVPLPLALQLDRAATAALVVAGSIIAAVLLWLGVARVLADMTGLALAGVRGGLATVFVAPALLVALAHVVGFDSRLPTSFAHDPRVLGSGLALLLALGLVPLAVAALRGGGQAPGPAPSTRPWRRLGAWPQWLFVAALTAVGLALRLSDMAFEPLHHDEAQQLLWIQGILERGYPSVVLDGRVRTVFTSELAQYVKTPIVWLFGPNEFGMRLCEVLFGALTIPLLYRVGRAVYDARVGALAAIVYTLLPSAIGMTHHGRYPSPLQFTALLTVGLLFEAVRGGTLRPGRYWGAVAAFVATYLTWEGSAFFLPSLALGAVVLTRPRLGWLRSGHVWLGIAVIGFVAVTQFSLRVESQQEWQVFGSSIYDVSLAPMWRYPFYDPTGYLTKFFFLENHWLLTLLLVAGMPWWWRRSRSGRVLAFLGTILLVDLLLMTHLLEIVEWRYVYYLLPLPILSAAVGLVVFLDRLLSLSAGLGAPGRALRGIAAATVAVLVVMVPVLSTSYLVKLHDAPWSYGAQYTRLGARYNAAMAGPAAYLREHRRPGDLVVAVSPQVLHHYGVHADYHVQTRLRLPLFLALDGAVPMNRHTGVPTLLSEAELRDAYARGSRVWVVSFDSRWPNPELGVLLEQDARVAYEDWQATVFLMGKPVAALSVTTAQADR
jgi:hypothetical protein